MQRRSAIVGLLLLLVLLAVAPVAYAFESMEGEVVIIGDDEVIEDDLYVTAGKIILNGKVEGDLVALGGTIEVNGDVQGDLIAAGQEVNVSGTVGDDVRVMGFSVVLGNKSEIGDDLVGAGYSLEAQTTSSVGGDVVFGGYQALLAGDVAGDLNFGGNGLDLQGKVGGDVKADFGEPSEMPVSPAEFMPDTPPIPAVKPGLSVGKNAEVGGNLTYTSAAELAGLKEAVKGKVTRKEPQYAGKEAPSVAVIAVQWALGRVGRFIALLLVGLPLVWFLPTWTNRLSKATKSRPIATFGWGIVHLVAVALGLAVIALLTVLLAIILGFVTFGKITGLVIWLGVVAFLELSFVFVLSVEYLANIIVGVTGGRLILGRINPDWGEGRIWPLVLGLVILVPVTGIPCVGQIIGLLVALLGLGALWLVVRDHFWPKKGQPAAESTEAVDAGGAPAGSGADTPAP